ncbi:hypothetical protein ACP70R_012796 [Stipagrostis hirtigluma subsp. patula]
MDGYYDDGRAESQVTVTNWTLLLAPGSWQWTRDDAMTLCIGDLWADETFLAIPELPQRLPMCPVLGPRDASMVSLFMTDIADVDGHITTKGEHVLGLNMQSKKLCI